jgi:hypothetical protein
MIVSPGVIGPLGTISAKLHPILSSKADKTFNRSQVALDPGLTKAAKGEKNRLGLGFTPVFQS